MCYIVIYSLYSWTTFSTWYAYLSSTKMFVQQKLCSFLTLGYIQHAWNLQWSGRFWLQHLTETTRMLIRHILKLPLSCNNSHVWVTTLARRLHYAGGICKQRFHSENTSNVFLPHYAEGFWNAAITGHIEIVFEETSSRKITLSSWCNRYRKAPFTKCFPSTLKRKVCVLKFLRFEERFRKASFSLQINVDGRHSV